MKDFQERASEAFDLRAVLEHARGLFCYHAQQRLSSIRYFFIAWGVIAVGYSGVIAAPPDTFQSDPAQKDIILSIISFSAVVITTCFWALDQRNAQLTHINERAITELEWKISEIYDLPNFPMAYFSKTESALLQYRNVIHFIFGSTLIISFLAFIDSANFIFSLFVTVVLIFLLFIGCKNSIQIRHGHFQPKIICQNDDKHPCKICSLEYKVPEYISTFKGFFHILLSSPSDGSKKELKYSWLDYCNNEKNASRSLKE